MELPVWILIDDAIGLEENVNWGRYLEASLVPRFRVRDVDHPRLWELLGDEFEEIDSGVVAGRWHLILGTYVGGSFYPTEEAIEIMKVRIRQRSTDVDM